MEPSFPPSIPRNTQKRGKKGMGVWGRGKLGTMFSSPPMTDDIDCQRIICLPARLRGTGTTGGRRTTCCSCWESAAVWHSGTTPYRAGLTRFVLVVRFPAIRDWGTVTVVSAIANFPAVRRLRRLMEFVFLRMVRMRPVENICAAADGRGRRSATWRLSRLLVRRGF